jgi:hypothetical protein
MRNITERGGMEEQDPETLLPETPHPETPHPETIPCAEESADNDDCFSDYEDDLQKGLDEEEVPKISWFCIGKFMANCWFP